MINELFYIHKCLFEFVIPLFYGDLKNVFFCCKQYEPNTDNHQTNNTEYILLIITTYMWCILENKITITY